MTKQHSSSLQIYKSDREPKHIELLVSLVTLLIVQSFLDTDSIGSRILFNSMVLLVILSSIRSFSKSKNRLIVAMTLGAIAGHDVDENAASGDSRLMTSSIV